MYRPFEKQRRHDYEGKFDPTSIMGFITTASFPNVIDITNGFTTILLFRQPRKVAILNDCPSEIRIRYGFLQKAKVDAVFGYRNTLTLPDESLFQEIVTHVDTPAMPSTGGCPFMSGGAGGRAVHEEL